MERHLNIKLFKKVKTLFCKPRVIFYTSKSSLQKRNSSE